MQQFTIGPKVSGIAGYAKTIQKPKWYNDCMPYILEWSIYP